MSSSFIGSKIAIITKTQCRYVGTIIGIDSQTSSILLGTVKCYGTENRPGNVVTSQMAGTVVPVMQFANSDIEDLKIVDEEGTVETPKAPAPAPVSQPVVPAPAAPIQPSIHDDPAIVSAVMSSSNHDKRSVPSSSTSSRLMNAFEQLTLTDPTSRTSGHEMKSVWGTTSEKNNQSKAISRPPPQENKSRFFDDFHQNNPNEFAFQSNNRQSSHSNHDRPFRSSNGHSSNGPRAFLNQHHRPMSNNNNNQHQRRPGGNRETFQGSVNDIDDEFDFESNNRSFNKIVSEDEFKQQTDVQPSQLRPMPMPMDNNNSSSTEYQPLYDKKKSFFDNTVQMNSHGDSLMGHHRLQNQDTFGNDGFYNQRSKQRNMGNSHRRANHNNNYRQQGNDDFYYRQNNNNNNNNNSNGYSYRY